LAGNGNLLVDIILIHNSINDKESYDSITAKAKAHEVLKAIAKEQNIAPTFKKGATTTLIPTDSNMSSRSVKSSALTMT
jgi:hypothetical protein